MSDPRPDPAGYRPRSFPPPEFPPRKPRLFARMPPAVFPALMGLLGLGLALRRGLQAFGLPPEPAELLLGVAVALWAFAAVGYAVKIGRRPGVVAEDLRTLPGRAGLAAGSLGALLVAAVMVPYDAGVAQGVLWAGLGLHGVLALLVIRHVLLAPKEGHEVTPVWHLHFAGFIIGGLSAVPLGLTQLATGLVWLTGPIAVAIWLWSLWQIVTRVPPAPLRPLLAIHLAPASLLATVSAGLGLWQVAIGFGVVAALIALALLFGARHMVISGFSALWGAFTFPLAALAGALFALQLDVTGAMILAFGMGFIPYVVVRVLVAWMKGGLAARTNAAEA